MRIQICFFCKCSSVNTGQHFIFLISSPVSSGGGDQFHRFERLGTHQMRTGTKVDIFALLIERNLGVFRKILDQFHFVRLFAFFHKFNCFIAGKSKSFQLCSLFYDLFHLFFDLVKRLAVKRFHIKIIIETVLDRRSDRTFRMRIQTFDRLCQHMGCGVAVSCLSGITVKGQNV